MVLDESKPCSCTHCSIEFRSKTQLFRHLEDQHGFAGKDSKPTKVVLLVGWLASAEARDTEIWLKDAPLNCSGHDSPFDVQVEATLVRAISTVDSRYGDSPDSTTTNSNGEEQLPFERPKGFCRCSSSTQRNSYLLSVEDTCHRSCDVIGYQGKKIPGGREEEMKWVDEVNELLPDSIRVLGRYTLPASGSQFHAEMNCSQRVFEYMLPLNIAMPSHLAVMPSEKIIRRSKQTHDRSTWSEMDIVFPADTDDGQARIAFFRNLKKVLKRLIGHQFLHNFATGGASPDEAASDRKLDRVFHKDLVTIDGQDWVVFSASGDSLLRGQVRRLLGLSLAICWGWLPLEYLDSALSPDIVCDVPALPGSGLTIAECRYSIWEARQLCRIDPRRVLDKSEEVFEADTTRLDSWAAVVQAHTARLMDAQGYDWVNTMKDKCMAALAKAQAGAALTSRTHLQLAEGLVKILGEHPQLHQDGQDAGSDARTYTAEEIVRDGSVSVTAGYGRTAADAGTIASLGEKDEDGGVKGVNSSNGDALLLLPSVNKTNVDHAVLVDVERTTTTATTTEKSTEEEAERSQEKRKEKKGGKKEDGSEGGKQAKGGGKKKFFRKDSKKNSSSSTADHDAAAGAADAADSDANGTTTSSTTSSASDKKGDIGRGCGSSRPPNKKQKKLVLPPKKPADIDGVNAAAEDDDRSEEGESPRMVVAQPQSLYWRPPPSSSLQNTQTHAPVAQTNAQTDVQTHAPEVYRKVLRLLREADSSGLWPLSSVARQRVMDSDMDQKQAGSFSVGALPKHMTQPKGNTVFPELMKACFELERALCPHRLPSSTIAINRHAQFRPHRDSGAGNGQSISLIVALGDFAGGEIAVEGEVHDIRYQPLEFDGWKERHWTLPFVGERYSLVWFTPLGVTQEDLWWWHE